MYRTADQGSGGIDAVAMKDVTNDLLPKDPRPSPNITQAKVT